MTQTQAINRCPRYFSYIFMMSTLLLVGALHLATPLLAALFAFFALKKLHRFQRWGRIPVVTVFVILVSAITYGIAFFSNQAVVALPSIADKAIPSIAEWAHKLDLELPFSDFDGLISLLMDEVPRQTQVIGNFARIAREATMQVVFLLIGVVVAVSIFLGAGFELDRDDRHPPLNLYSQCCDEIAMRFSTFFHSFTTVMGAQIAISAINTVATAIFVLAVNMPHPIVIVGVTFFCGLLPIIGNLISNTIIVSVGFTVSPDMALMALCFLIVIHKMEYFLNSKIIGARIRNPLWLTLLGLIMGEKIMGIPGMILAPVLLHYIKIEASQIVPCGFLGKSEPCPPDGLACAAGPANGTSAPGL